MKLSIIIPAYNEEKRIGRTISQYVTFFDNQAQLNHIQYELVVVLNGCKDKTYNVVQQAQKNNSSIRVIDLPAAGKGLAVTAGFKDALTRDNDLIGFVDADCATAPQQFCELTEKIGDAHGIIASRYMKASQIYPANRPWIKEWGRKLVYNPIIRALYRMPYVDYQCGAKLFTRAAMEKIAPDLISKQWAFDVELLYRCKQQGLRVCEIPTVWHDQTDSKFNMQSGLRMIGALFSMRFKNPKKSKQL